MRRHLFARRRWFNEQQLIKLCSYFFAILLWPIFAAAELTQRIAATLSRWRL
jgi:hypothetical protein